MDGANAQSWQGMDAAGDQDFGNLIDFNHFEDLDLPDFNNIAFSHGGPQNGTMADALDHHLDHQFPPQISQNHGDGANGTQQAHGAMGTHSVPQSNVNANFFDYGMSQFTHAGTPVFSQPPEQAYRPHHGVPPTPNSVEMHGDPHRYVQQMDQQAAYDQRYHMRKDDASFTPLVSPAVTPHDLRFQIPDFTVPGAYFSPLTSPALNAQAHQHAQSQLHSQASTSVSSTGHSPIDVDMDLLGEPAMTQPSEQRRSLRTKRTAPRAAPANRIRQSPIVRPGRRKPTVSMQLPPKEVSELMQEARNGLDVPRSRDYSETDSISPEPMLSDMRPPPLPGSVKNSPALIAQNCQGAAPATPATPASLMRIHPSPQFDILMNAPPMLEDLALPEASLESRPSLSRIDTAFRDADHDTPRMSARKTPKMGPLSTPGAAMSNKPSPMLDAMSTPTSPAFSMISGKKVEAKGRNLKKRGSVSSSLVSPALRPKISPSIRPMIAAGESGTSDNTHALLLASKSNYQNILDGTTVPGVSYPASLSTNLTSKRTSHKIAEQGRRNRINTALQEMQDLLPPGSQAALPDAKSPETAAQSNNSKAAKVESAIEYIKHLKGEVSAKDRMLEQKDAEMESLRKQLAQLRRGSSVGVSSNDSPVESAVGSTAELKMEPAATPAASDET
ncbi:hypothetical protein C7974DRAFT_398939 [Boeremia exigua]|uniref:uncharacterized protein n=1 Tax=Boeremia exigua TaxID=749465 RepID=UPI001E8D8F0B|nr:uncharacterized protein C7974DRAFT_398939 [Boeremia exigua]KAH6620120.1 hypothetical protein C7974DRAFT_398939 [Boeremia exigua]